MSEEIKEILDDLKKTADNCVFMVCRSQEELDQMPRYTSNFMSINDRQAKILLKYIKDLQQKVEQLEKENKELKEENKRIFQNVNDDELLISNAMNYAELKKAEKMVEQLENIRKEAIEYLKEFGFYGFNKNWQDLLNILNKGSEE